MSHMCAETGALLRPRLTGGRAAQMLAAKAYDLHNAELQGTGLTINTPETMWNVPLAEARPPRPPAAPGVTLRNTLTLPQP
jgi:hypothetical protein